MPRVTKADLEARVAELEAELAASDCLVCATAGGGVAAGVRRDLSAMSDAVRAAPGLAASALKLAERLDGTLLDLAPAPLHAELRNTLTALRAHHTAKAVSSPSDDLAERRRRRRATPAAQ